MASFFSPEQTLRELGLTGSHKDVVDFGCGYGTFSIPAARIIEGRVHAFDIEADMIAATRSKAEQASLSNVYVEQRDFMTNGTGLSDASVDYAMLFNILHCEQPTVLLMEAWRILARDGRLGIIHWNNDASTPRGPAIEIRPRPEQCRTWAEQVGFHTLSPDRIDLPPYHYGCILKKP